LPSDSTVAGWIIDEMTTSHAPLVLVAVGAVFLCACSSDSELSCEQQQIVNGTLSAADPAVVALAVGGQPFCTGTVVSPRVVVTAAHCLPPNVDWGTEDIVVAFGSNASSPEASIPAVESIAHPGWTIQDLPNDIGAIRLATDAPVAPMPMNRTPLTNDNAGQTMRMVGFGITGSFQTDSGFKRQGDSTISFVDQTTIYYDNTPSGTCNGDSGGPAFLVVGGNAVFAGIHSRSDCEFTSMDERVDIHVSTFIEPFIAGMAPATCGMDGQCASGCSRPDPDCLCAGDGFCSSYCTDAVADPDCNDACAPDGTCIESGCPAPDVDCGECADDGVCNSDCASDPDCCT